MMEMVQENWPLLLVAFLIGLVVAFLLFKANRKTRVIGETGDVLDEGAAPAARNKALIDAPPVATPTGLGGAGAAVALAADANAKAATDAAGADDLTRIKGVGPKLAAILHGEGVTRFEQIAGWNDADIDRIDAKLGRFEGRIRRDDWVSQAAFLAANDMEGYRARFGATE